MKTFIGFHCLFTPHNNGSESFWGRDEMKIWGYEKENKGAYPSEIYWFLSQEWNIHLLMYSLKFFEMNFYKNDSMTVSQSRVSLSGHRHDRWRHGLVVLRSANGSDDTIDKDVAIMYFHFHNQLLCVILEEIAFYGNFYDESFKTIFFFQKIFFQSLVKILQSLVNFGTIDVHWYLTHSDKHWLIP